MTARRLGVAAALTDDGVVSGDVEVVDGAVTAVGVGPAGRSGLAIPGLIDLHVHGGAGVDFMDADPDAYRRAGRQLLSTGVTAYQAALMCAPTRALERALGILGALQAGDGPRVLGAHLEGPFLAPERLGTHNPEHRRDPDTALLARLIDAGPVAEVTLAPELPGALDLIALLTSRGIVAAVGHTDATAAQARAAFAAGAAGVTHLFNAMRPLHHREPGVAGAALDTADVTLELIVDGHHLAPEIVRLVWRAAQGRVALVTDGTAAVGMPAGTYVMGDIELVVRDGAVRNRAGALAGSALTMIAAVRNVHALGVTLTDAVAAATRVPARLIGRADLGVLHPGAAADLVVLDDHLDVRETFVAGDRRHAG